jgi:2'-5' RNA ligase
MRLFTGIGLPAPVAESLVEAARKHLPVAPRTRIRPTSAGNTHITLSFLGSVDTTRLNAIRQALAGIASPPFLGTLNGLGMFAHAGVFLAKVEPSPLLLDLAEQVAASLETCGIPREPRPYQPHVTLARGKGLVGPVSVADAPAFHQAFEVSEFRLYESVTRAEGAQYEVLSVYPLG